MCLRDTMELHRHHNGCVGHNTPSLFFLDSNELTFFLPPRFSSFFFVSFTSFLVAIPFFLTSLRSLYSFLSLPPSPHTATFHSLVLDLYFIPSLSLPHFAIGVPSSILRVDQALSNLWCGQTQQNLFCMPETINPIHSRIEYLIYIYIYNFICIFYHTYVHLKYADNDKIYL